MKPPINPYPGLRPFRKDEQHLFFGRENQVDAMVDKLSATRFLAVIGGSGSGKSSLVNCGLRPALYGGLMARAGTAWRIAKFRPGHDPIGELARALANDGVLFDDYQETGLTLAEIVDTTLRMSKIGLIDIYEQSKPAGDVNLLVVVDQFEELFRYRELGARGSENAFGVSEEATAFVNLLLEIKEQTKYPIYVVLTMRSDFLSDCTQFTGLAEAINAGQYLVPRMTRDERRAAISGPAGVGEAEISPVLLTRLVNDVGDNPDQLSILQHALNRTWANWQNSGGAGPLDLPHYEAIGSMTHALDYHAEEAYAELDTARQQKICEKIFKALTDTATDPRGVRRPTTLGDLCALAGDAPSEVSEVIEIFRHPSRSFLMPPAGEPLESETVIDISHESLMRVWERLKAWAEEEAHSAQIYRRLAETSVLFENGRAGLWKDPDLQLALEWSEHNQPNDVWAHRYHPEFGGAMEFLKKSRSARRRRWWTAAAITMLVFVSLAGFLVYALIEKSNATAERNIAERLLYDANIFRAQDDILSRNFQRGRELLTNLKRPGLNELRGFEWYLLWRQLPDERGLFSVDTDSVTSVAFSPDGKTLATVSGEKNIKLWNPSTKELIGTLSGHTGVVNSVVFAPDGKTLATASRDQTVKLWDAESRSELATLTGHTGEIYSAAFAPDGKTLATASADQTVKLWDVATRTQSASLAGHSGEVWAVAFSPDGESVATGGLDESIKLWSTRTFKATGVLPQEDAVSAIAFAPDGKMLAAGIGDNSIRLWNVSQRRQTAVLNGHFEPVSSLAFSADGRTLASGGEDNNIKLWDFAGQTELATLKGHVGAVQAVAFAPDGKTLASGSEDNSVKLWDTESYQELVPENTGVETLTGHQGAITSVVFSPDGKTLATASRDRSVRLWDTASRRETAVLTGHTREIRAVAFSPDGKMLATASGDNTAKLWDVASQNLIATLTGHSREIWTVDFSPDGKTLATGSGDATVKLWDVATLQDMATLSGHAGQIYSLAFSPDGETLATAGADNTVRLWDVATRQQKALLTGHSDEVWAVTFAPNGEALATGSKDKTIKIWDVATGRESRTVHGHSGAIWSLAFTPDGRTLATGSDDNSARLWDFATGNEVATLIDYRATVSAVAFSPDGKTLATGSRDKIVRLWFAAPDD